MFLMLCVLCYRAPIGNAMKPAGDILILSDYRTRYALYMTDPDLVRARHLVAWICKSVNYINKHYTDRAMMHTIGHGAIALSKVL